MGRTLHYVITGLERYRAGCELGKTIKDEALLATVSIILIQEISKYLGKSQNRNTGKAVIFYSSDLLGKNPRLLDGYVLIVCSGLDLRRTFSPWFLTHRLQTVGR